MRYYRQKDHTVPLVCFFKKIISAHFLLLSQGVKKKHLDTLSVSILGYNQAARLLYVLTYFGW